MKNKIKKVFKNRIFICILTALITGTISVYAVTYFPSNQVTYDNKTSGLKSSDVQGAIDELYNTCSSAVQAGDYIYFTTSLYSGDESQGGYIYRMSVNGGDSKLIFHDYNNAIEGLYVVDDYIYFTATLYGITGDSQGTYIYRISVNGGDPKLIFHDYNNVIEGLYVVDNYIYFTATLYSSGDSQHGYIYRISVNGGEPKLIFDAYNNAIEGIFIK